MFKIDTREKFTIITPTSDFLSASLTENLSSLAISYLTKEIKSVVLKMSEVKMIEENAVNDLVQLHQQFYSNGASFVICEVTPEVLQTFDELDVAEVLNITPTESEAWDIVQMEELERELMSDEE